VCRLTSSPATAPVLMGEILGLLRKMSRGEIGPKPTQIVVATTPRALEFAEPKEVRFMNRDADGGVVVEEALSTT